MNMIKTVVYVLRLINQFLEEKKIHKNSQSRGPLIPRGKYLRESVWGRSLAIIFVVTGE